MNYVCSDSVIFSQASNGRLTLFNPASQQFFELDDVGQVIWTCLSNKLSTSEIVRSICSEYSVSKEQAKLDVGEFLSDLYEIELVEEVNDSY